MPEAAGGVKLDRTSSASGGGPLFEVEHLSLVYPNMSGHPAATVLSDVSLTVERGEALALVGPSRSGKSSLLRCLNRLGSRRPKRYASTAGTSARWTRGSCGVGAALVMQTPVVFEGTVRDNLRIRARDAAAHLSESELRDSPAESGLDPPVLPREATTLSGGEEQRDLVRMRAAGGARRAADISADARRPRRQRSRTEQEQ